MGQISYSTIELNKAMKLNVTPDFFSLKANSETPMTQNIVVANTYQDVLFNNVDDDTYGNLNYDGSKVTYLGTEPVELTINMACSLSSNLNNTIIHLGQAQNGVIDTGAVSTSECSLSAQLQSFNIASKFILQPNDTLNLKIKTNKIAVVDITHFQVVIKQNKISGVI